MSEIKTSEGLVGYARKNGIGAAKAVWQYLQTKSPANVNSEVLTAKMKELNKPIITKDDIKRLKAVEVEEAKKSGLKEFKFASNEEMLQLWAWQRQRSPTLSSQTKRGCFLKL